MKIQNGMGASGDPMAQKQKAWRSVSKEKKKEWREMRLLKQAEKHKQLKLAAAAASPPAAASAGTSAQFPSQLVRRDYTVCLAVAGSIMDNAQSAELRAYLAGQVARAAAIFCVDEVVVFNDRGAAALQPGLLPPDGCQQMARLLQYMECPQYLRRHLFPVHDHLRFAGLVNPLDCPHHLRREQVCRYREGVVTAESDPDGRTPSASWYVNVGLRRNVRVDRRLSPGVRVTVQLPEDGRGGEGGGCGQLVSPQEPRRQLGVYWGYTVRVANSLDEVLSGGPHADGYDLRVGTSDRGQSLQQLDALPAFRHLLVVFGGLQGLEAALENDDKLTADDPRQLFDLYVNACEGQGSRTIRTEEAVLITLAALKPKIEAAATAAVDSKS